MTWNVRKLVFSGIMAVAYWAINLAVATPFAVTLGPGSAGVIFFFLTPLLSVSYRRIVNEVGALVWLGIIESLLFLPTPSLGPPGFLPKIIIIMTGTVLMEIVYFVLRKKPMIAGVISGSVLSFLITLIMVIIFRLLEVPAGAFLLALAIPFLVLAAFEGALGGWAGETLYKRVENRPLVARIRAE